MGGVQRNRRERGQCLPCPLRHREPVGLPGLILCPRSLPPAAQNPSPATTPPPGALPLHSETPSNELGLRPTHTPSPRALRPNSGTAHCRGPPFEVLPLPFRAGPKQMPRPMLKRHPHPHRSHPTLNPAPA